MEEDEETEEETVNMIKGQGRAEWKGDIRGEGRKGHGKGVAEVER